MNTDDLIEAYCKRRGEPVAWMVTCIRPDFDVIEEAQP